jgi:hypothetical protein
MRVIATSLAGLLALGVSAEASQCYRRVVQPAQYGAVSEQVLASPEREVADYAPAVTRQVEESVVVRPERTYTRVIPAEYGETHETVEVSPAQREWRTRWENGEAIGCWVRVPARYADRIRRVLTNPAREITQTVPEQTATRLRTEIVEPAHTITRTIPARYVTRERRVLESPAQARWAPIENCNP